MIVEEDSLELYFGFGCLEKSGRVEKWISLVPCACVIVISYRVTLDEEHVFMCSNLDHQELEEFWGA